MLLVDNSAFWRLHRPRLPDERVERIAALIERAELAACLPFMLEAGYSARNVDDHGRLMERLGRFPRVAITPIVEDLALAAQAELARTGHHRVTPVDLIIAAAAHEIGGGVLHYDGHYDVIASMTSLEFASEWLAPPGSLD